VPAAAVTLARLYPSLAPGVYRRLWIGVVPYHLCFQVGLVATGTAAIALSRSALEVGLMLGAWGLPILFMPPFGGVAADRAPRRRTMLGAQVVLGGGALIAGALGLIGQLAVWHLILLGVLQGTVYAFFAPARNAYTARAVPKALIPNAAAAYSLSEHAGAVLGPALGGLLIAGFGLGYAWAYVLVAATHALVFFIFAGLPEQAPTPDASERPVLASIRDGIRYASGVPALRVVLVLSAVAMILGMPFRQLMPVFADDVYGVGAVVLGLLLTAAGGGAILGSISVSRFRGDIGLGRWPAILGAFFGAGAILFALAPSFESGLVLAAVAGAAAAAFTTINAAIVVSAPSPAYYGRTASLYQLTFALGPLGAIPIAALADQIGAPRAVALGGLLLLVSAPLLARLLRGEDRGAPSPPSGSSQLPAGTTPHRRLEEDR
jgi:MFS family permease